MSAFYFEDHCGNCRGGIEFPAHGIGEVISCPHCGCQVTLVFPPESEGGATKLIETYLQSSEFPSKRSELFLLSQFAGFPREATDLRGVDCWRIALGAEPSAVVTRLVQIGMLENGSDNVPGLLQTKSAKDLKDLAQNRGLAKSGTKEVTAKRLFKHDPEGMRELFRGKAYLICSQKGEIITGKYLKSEDEIKVMCEQAIFSALMEGRLKDACSSVATFEASRVFPRGLGTDWHNYDCTHDLAVLQLIFKAQFKRLAPFDDNNVLRFRIGASMMHLWGTNKLPKCVSIEDPDSLVESKMILFSALGSLRLQEMKLAGINRVKILGSGLPDTCSICQTDDGKTYPISAAPILPHDKCTCDGGCCCMFLSEQSFDLDSPLQV